MDFPSSRLISAGLSLYFEDGHDDLDDFGFDDYGSECDGIRITAFLDAGQDNLTPLGRLEKYAFSENVFNRQIVARGLLDVLREFSDNENDFISVMETVARMSEDGEPTVRAELMEQVPNIAMFLHESRPNFPAAFSRYLVPIVVRYLTDPNNQVRKTSQAALLVLLEQGLISKADMETKVCPVLLDLTEPSSDDDYKIEAVSMMCKVVTMLSKDTVEHLLLPRFCDLCSDARLFQVRKTCAIFMYLPQESEMIEEDEEEDEEEEDEEGGRDDSNVIPQQLLDQYLSMTDPARAQTVDTEIAKHCAFSLPGVALTLGRQNWHCLKETYETLATDVQWKVRRTLAFSIHELAVILGDQLTAADLVPIFNGFLKDLDEVRIGVLKHLYDFLKLLHADKRREYLYQLQEFMVTDNSRNWRFRYELAEQLILIIELYSHFDVYDYLRQIALTLCSDKVSEVRWISYKLVVEILQKLYACGADELGLNFINELTVRFCHCPKWVGRQAFAFICQAIVEEDCMPMEQFGQHLLPSLLSLSSDPVANVRVLVAKALRQSVMEKAYFKEPGCAYSDELEETVMALQSDKDRDVRFFASLDPSKGLMDTAPLI
uniref:Protein phosphatase 4, regulatory subunit 1-like n=1 Tax=Gasterosteus aculeatus aculeatus TaxID=481459 RepID=A0AAQ4RRD2_GASAC